MATQAALHATSKCPAAWEHYWKIKEYKANDRRAVLIHQLTVFFRSPNGWPLLSPATTRHASIVLPLDWTQLLRLSGISDLDEAMLHAPADALKCLGAAAHEALFIDPKRHPPATVEGPAIVHARLRNHTDSFIPVSAIRADQIGRLVTIRGTVTRATPARPMVTCMQFVCGKCGGAQDVEFPDGRFTPPASCRSDGCRSRTLAPNRRATRCADWQRVQVQGLPRDERTGEGRVPRPADVELLHELVETAAPGEVITVTGIVKVLQGEPASGKRFGGDAKRQCLFLPYVEAVSVVKGAGVGGRAAGPAGSGAAEAAAIVAEPEGVSYLPPNMPGFTRLDLDFIRTFTETCEGDQLRQLVRSLAPNICGMESEKAGLLLALLGGVRKGGSASGDSSDSVPVRGDIHVLLVGDPGLGKSQLLQAAAAAAPRGVYVCGTGASSAGLTVSVTRDGGDYCFDAGALVLADRGVCCVDEFDKVTAEHAAMLGAMEQQEVAVAKAGLVATLPARTTVLAAANPVEGHYNRGKTLMQNLKMSPAMVSRFDLVFLLLDRPDAERDQRLTEHVMAEHSGLAARAHAARAGLLEGPAAPLLLINTGIANGGGRLTLKERLKQRKADDELLPPQLLRKYIAYARQYVHPVLTPPAAAELKTFYLGMRERSASDPGAPPVTHRQLESLVRLAEARARAELRVHVTAEDALDAVEIMKESLGGMLAEGGGGIDFGGPPPGVGGGRGGRGFQAERRRFVEALQRHCEAAGRREIETHELYGIADRIELAMPDTAGFIEMLNEAGDLLKKGGGKFAFNGGLRLRQPPPATTQREQQGGRGGGASQQQQQYGKGGGGLVRLQHPAMGGKRRRMAAENAAAEEGEENGDDGFDW